MNRWKNNHKSNSSLDYGSTNNAFNFHKFMHFMHLVSKKTKLKTSINISQWEN